jgi:hypothetical protein
MQNRNRDRENQGNRERESGLGSTSSPGGSKDTLDRGTRSGNRGSSSSNVGSSPSGSRERDLDEQRAIGSHGRSSDLESER